MKCNKCDKEAVIHYAEVVNGKIKKLDLCEECAAKQGLGTKTSFSMSDLLAGIADSETSEKQIATCNFCNMTFDEFKKNGRLGCSKCFEIFKKPLESMIEQIHRSSKHKGKVPSIFHNERYRKDYILAMEKDLKEAIKAEDFEKAAYLRDEILKEKQKNKT